MTLSKKELEFNSWSRPFKNSPTLKNAKKKKKMSCALFLITCFLTNLKDVNCQLEYFGVFKGVKDVD